MKYRAVFGCLLSTITIVGLSGCQAGKLNMPNLAFWNKNDQLASEYVEPPSHNFTPGDTELAATSAPADNGQGPPARPESAVESPSLEAFAEKVNQSLDQLEPPAGNPAPVSTFATADPVAPSSQATAPPTGDTGFSAPLVPRKVSRFANQLSPSGSGGPSPADDQNRFQPGPVNSPPLTNYERLAASTLSGPPPVSEPPVSRGELPEGLSSNVPEALQAPPLKPESRPLAEQAVEMQNPYAGPPRQAAAPGGSPSAYATTPYKSFNSLNPETDQQIAPQNPEIAPQNPVNEAPANPGDTVPATLRLSGQGSYAPGSIRRPDPVQPTTPQVPRTAGGGEFRQ